MSTRQLLNLTMGAFSLLLVAAIGIGFNPSGNDNEQDAQINLAVRQQTLIQDLSRHSAQLSGAEDRAAMNLARQNLAVTILQFDRNLAALLHGGEGVDAAGHNSPVQRTRDDLAQTALSDAAQLWLETGMPLADLAAGEFSVYSAAGQTAVRSLQGNSVALMQHMGTAANAMRMGVRASNTIAKYARWAAGGLGLVVLGFGFYRRKTLAAEEMTPLSTPMPSANPEPSALNNAAAPRPRPVSEPAAPRVTERPQSTFASPVNFVSVSASVDQMSVDMNTIAGSTEKMRLAIDSVGHALQDMLSSLNEMVQDTAEGHKIVRNAHNAASFSADTASELTTSAREMSAVVARVAQLAMSTKAVAAQIDGDALQTGKTGEAFTSVVAGEVKGLAHQTNEATQQIENTVSDILATGRQYEEAIGQIIKNVSAINKVSQDLGDLMVSPPPRVEPVDESATDNVPEFDQLFTINVSSVTVADEVTEGSVAETTTAIEEMGQEANDGEPEAELQDETPDSFINEVFMLDQPTTTENATEPELATVPADRPVATGSSDNIFMLNKPK